jgi:SNF2 family DNA or RNA helicase
VKGTVRELQSYQLDGADFLASRRSALLADEMGLGKTIEAIAALRILANRKQIRRVLILAPSYLVSNWESELLNWAPTFWVEAIRGAAVNRSDQWHGDAQVFVVGYETLRADIAQVKKRPFDVLILDEAQKIKSRLSKVHLATKELRAYRKWALSGTPIENSFEEYKAIFEVISPGLLGGGGAEDEPLDQRDLMRSQTLRRTRQDVLSLPPLVQEEVWLDLGSRQREAYDALVKQTLKALKKNPTTGHALALLSKLLQVCNIDEETGDSCKLEYLESALCDLSSTDSGVLVFSSLPQKTLKRIAPRIAWCAPTLISGETPPIQRAELVRRFQESKGFSVALVSTMAGGLGLNLTRASYVFHFDHWWTPAAKDQADARAHRYGQTSTVFSYSLFTKGTVEESVARILRDKRSLFESVLEGTAQVTDTNITSKLIAILREAARS